MSTDKFPTTLLEAVCYFADEGVCRDFLARLRWPNGVRCVFCDSDRIGFVATRSLWRCKDCRKSFSVKKGTIFEDSPMPLSKWLPAMWLYSAGKKGHSSHQLARDLGVTQKTAWFIGHRIRLAMEADEFNRPLSGEVEADETFIGGKERFKHLDKPRPQPEDRPARWSSWGSYAQATYARRRCFRTESHSYTARSASTSRRGRGSTPTRSDRARAWMLSTSTRSSTTRGICARPGAYERSGELRSVFKRMLYGTHHSVHPVHLDRYLAEATHRFNNRAIADAELFTKTASRVAGRRLTYGQLTGKIPVPA